MVREEGELSMSGWWFVTLSAASLGSAAAPVQLAQTYAQPGYTYPQPARSAWDTYKLRLSILARQQGVRDSTIQANVPNLTVNQRVISMEATEPVARSSGGVVGTLAPYLRSHVTPSLVRRGQANYSDHYQALRSLEARYGVDAGVLMAIWGHETSY